MGKSMKTVLALAVAVACAFRASAARSRSLWDPTAKQDAGFGTSIAMSSNGSRLAIGAMHDDSDVANGAGAVYLFNWDGTQARKLVASDGGADDAFGWAVSMNSDGSRLAITAHNRNSHMGAVYLFTWDGAQQRKITPSFDSPITRTFAWAVAMSSDGNRLAISELGHAVHLYTWDGTPAGKLTASDGVTVDEAIHDGFGWSLAMSSDGSRLAIGAVGFDVPVHNAGSVCLFLWDGTLERKLVASDPSVLNQLGMSVAMSSDGSQLAIGATVVGDVLSDGLDLSVTGVGAVYLFNWNGTQERKLVSSDSKAGDAFGFAVAMSSDGSRLAIAALHGDSKTEDDAGAVYLLASDGEQQTVAKVTASDSLPGSFFGYCVSMSSDGDRLSVGVGGTYGNEAYLIDELPDVQTARLPPATSASSRLSEGSARAGAAAAVALVILQA